MRFIVITASQIQRGGESIPIGFGRGNTFTGDDSLLEEMLVCLDPEGVLGVISNCSDPVSSSPYVSGPDIKSTTAVYASPYCPKPPNASPMF